MGISHPFPAQVFDFDESGLLTVDEMILALRSTISGLCKLSGIDMPPETEIERIAVGAFANAKSIEGSTIEKVKFTKYCCNTPEIASWMEFYADIAETSKPLDASNDKKCERIIASLRDPMARGPKHRAVMDLEGGCAERIAVERGEGGSLDARPSPPWLSSVAFLEPVDFQEVDAATMPDECLELEWAHGFNAQRRQNVFYTKRSMLVYSAGAVGVVLDPVNGKQQFYNGHSDLVECLRVSRGAARASRSLSSRPRRSDVFLCRVIPGPPREPRHLRRDGPARRQAQGDGLELQHARGPRQGRKRVRKSQLQRLLSRSVSARFG